MKRMTAGKIVYEFFMTAYFQMLGNFGLDILEGEGKLSILKKTLTVLINARFWFSSFKMS